MKGKDRYLMCILFYNVKHDSGGGGKLRKGVWRPPLGVIIPSFSVCTT